MKSALKRIRPRAIVLTESEIWPNFILRAKKMGIPLFLINARVSDRSAPRYKLARFFFKDVFGAFTKIFAQSDLDAARIRAAMRAEDAAKVVVTGSFKFDVARRNEAKERELRAWIEGGKEEIRDKRLEIRCGGESEEGRVKSEELRRKILLGGSTWPGEDKVLLDIYKAILQSSTSNLQSSTSNLQPSTFNLQPLLVIAPRHFEKADEVEANIKAAGFSCRRRSRELGSDSVGLGSDRVEALKDVNQTLKDAKVPAVYLCDTTGEMMGLFGICDVAFVGKSLCAHGSQNMIEPCLCGKPTFVGPYTENFRPVMSDLLAADAIIQVKNAAELKAKIVAMFAEGASEELGARAKAAVENRRGVVAKCVKDIRAALNA